MYLPPTKVLFIIPPLRSRGADRLMSFLAQNVYYKVFNEHLLFTGNND